MRNSNMIVGMEDHPKTSEMLEYLAESVLTDPNAFGDEKWEAALFAQVYREVQQLGLFAVEANHLKNVEFALCGNRGYPSLKSSKQLACLVTSGASPTRKREIAMWSVGMPLDPLVAARDAKRLKAKKKRSSGAVPRNPPGYLSVPWAVEHAISMDHAKIVDQARQTALGAFLESAHWRITSEAWDQAASQESRKTVACALRNWAWAAREWEARNATHPASSVGSSVTTLGLSAVEQRLAHSRTAYEEAEWDIQAALKNLERSGHKISQSTFYAHLATLDKMFPGWRKPSRFPAHIKKSES